MLELENCPCCEGARLFTGSLLFRLFVISEFSVAAETLKKNIASLCFSVVMQLEFE